MKIRFYLKRPASKTSTAIFALINYNGNSVKVYPDESILPKFWNSKAQTARATPQFTEAPEFNERLNQIRSTFNKVFLEYRNNNGHASPPPAVFKGLVEKALKTGETKVTFLDYYEDFVKRTFAGKRIDPRNKKPVTYDAGKGYQTTLNHLKEFSKKYKVDFENIDLNFHREFTSYLSSNTLLLSANTIGMNIQRIKAVMAEATEAGVNNNMQFKSRHFIKQSENADTIYLNEMELKEMGNVDLSNKPRLDNVRDLFMIGCYTGLRFSDFSILSPQNIVDGFIRITQTKTGDPVIIPVHETVKNILIKHGGRPPKAYSNQKTNAYLKEVGQLMKTMEKIESKTITKGGMKTSNTMQKWELLTTHTARRSFATNEYLAGTPTVTIMAITGHKTEKSFLKYIRVTRDEHAHKIKELWATRTAMVDTPLLKVI